MTAPTYKLVVLGPGGVGKSALTARFATGKFLEDYDPTIEDVYRKSVVVDGNNAMLNILDTAGQEDFSCMLDSWVESGEGFLLVYNVVSRNTFEEVQLTHAKIMRFTEDRPQKVPILLIGNKCDLTKDRQVEVKEGEALAKKWGCPFLETSAKELINVENSFNCLLREIWKVQPPRKTKKNVCVIL